MVKARVFPGNLILIANTIGPIVTVEPNLVDWGNAHCLEAITRSVLVSNNSVIPASAPWQKSAMGMEQMS